MSEFWARNLFLLVGLLWMAQLVIGEILIVDLYLDLFAMLPDKEIPEAFLGPILIIAGLTAHEHIKTN